MIWLQLKHMRQVSTDACSSALSTDKQVSQRSSELESGWSDLVDSNWKPKISLFFMPKTQRRRLSET